MTFRLRHLFIEVIADDGRYGARLDFGEGLNVIRADNSMGKSTAMQSIVYALGLEGMFGPSQDVPLSHVVTNYVEHETGNKKVFESSVYVEIENGNGEYLTVQRGVRGNRNRHLMTVVEGRAITGHASGTSQDYFVRERFAAVSDRGFHKRLADFLGWELPTVPRFDDVDCPLYMEAIFPLLYVEQKLGWGKLPARFPTYLGIRDTARRCVEFVLGLDAYKIAIEKSAVHDEIGRIRTQWSASRAHAAKIARPASGIVGGIPLEPLATWPPEIPPQITLSRNGVWTPLRDHLKELRERLAKLQTQMVPMAGDTDSGVKSELAEFETQLAGREAALASLIERVESDRSECSALQGRINAVQDDLRKHKDLGRLRKLGSIDESAFPSDICPTCHQDIPDSLLDTGRKAVPMSVEQNIEFLEEQLQLFEAVLANARSSIEANEVEVHANRAEIENLRFRVRSLRETIMSPKSTPSIDVIAERIQAEQRLANLEHVLESFEDSMAEFAQLVDEWKSVEERRARLPKGSLSESDLSKMTGLESSFRNQLQLYHMESLDPQTVSISRGNYEPEVAGLNLSADVSASDLIRMQWAYLLSLLEVGRSFSTNHPAILMMDEPRQQDVQEKDFQAMLKYASGVPGAQLIVATSDESPGLPDFLTTIGASHVHQVKGRIINKI